MSFINLIKMFGADVSNTEVGQESPQIMYEGAKGSTSPEFANTLILMPSAENDQMTD